MIKYVVLFVATFLVVFISLSVKSHVKDAITNLTFKYKYKKAKKGSEQSMARLTQQAYIKGLNQGYALAKAQYDNRRAILYCSPDEYICQKCSHRVSKNAIDTPLYCNHCGSMFYTMQPTDYNPNNDIE